MTSEISFYNFLYFSIVLWGGGYGYTLLSKFVEYKIDNIKKWINILVLEILILMSFLIAGSSLVFGRYLGDNFGFFLSLFGLLLGMLLATYLLKKTIEKITSL